MSLAISTNSQLSATVTEPEIVNNTIENSTEVKDQASPSATSTNAPTTGYSEVQSNNFFAQTQRSILFNKLAATEKSSNGATPTNAASPAASASPTQSAGVAVNIADVKRVIAPNENGKRAANQGIRTTFEVTANGAKRPLTSTEINARSNRDQYLKLTDNKGNLTSLGKQFEQLKTNDSAVVTELGTDIHQLATLVNGGSKPTPEREATILAGLVTKGLASVAVAQDGKINFAIVPYRTAANSEIIAAGEQAKSDFENVRKILPGLKDVQGIVTFGASVYASTFVAVVAAPVGGVVASTASALTGQATQNVFQDGRLPTVREAATAIVLDRLFAGAGTVVGKVFNNIKYGTKLTELGITPGTQARNTAPKEISRYQTIFEGNVPRPEIATPSTATTSPAKSITGNELSEQYKKALLLQKSANNVSEAVPTPIINNRPNIESKTVESSVIKPTGIDKIESTGTKAVGQTQLSSIESAAKKEALQIEKLDGGHSVDRHGPEVSLSDLERRLKTGIAPDGKLSPAPASTKFNSYEAWVKTRDEALKLIETKYNIDLSKPPGPNGKSQLEIKVEFDKPIDDGFTPDVATKQKVMLTDPVTGQTKKGNIYSSANFIDGVTGSYTKVAWDQAQNKWVVVQHYPLAENWDNVAKAYTKTLDAKAKLQ